MKDALVRWHLLGLNGAAAVAGHVGEVDAEALWRPMATVLPTSKFPFISFC